MGRVPTRHARFGILQPVPFSPNRRLSSTMTSVTFAELDPDYFASR